MDRPLILVADDNLAIRALITEILELEGYPVVTAANGMQALELVERTHPALVILDMRMPVIDGWGFARELRARGVRVPVLMITAAQSARSWAAEIGADDYLAKPFGILELLTAVERLTTHTGGHSDPTTPRATHPPGGPSGRVRARRAGGRSPQARAASVGCGRRVSQRGRGES